MEILPTRGSCIQKIRDFAYPSSDLRHYYIYINRVPGVVDFLKKLCRAKTSADGEKGGPDNMRAFPSDLVDKVCNVDRIVVPELLSSINDSLNERIAEIKRTKVLHNFSKSTEYELECYEGEEVHRIFFESSSLKSVSEHNPKIERTASRNLSFPENHEKEKKDGAGDLSSAEDHKLDLLRSYAKIQIIPGSTKISSEIRRLSNVKNLYGNKWALVLKFHLRGEPQVSHDEYVLQQNPQNSFEEEYTTDPAEDYTRESSILVEVNCIGFIPVDFLEK